MTTTYDIVERVAGVAGVPASVIVGGSRTKGACWARWLVMYVVRELYPWLSLVDVAAVVGRQDHGTALHGLRRAERLYGDDGRFRVLVDDLVEHFEEQTTADQ